MSAKTDIDMITRRKLLTRDLKAICAMAVAPVAGQVIAMTPASAREHDGHGTSELFGFGRSRESGRNRRGNWSFWTHEHEHESHGREHHERERGGEFSFWHSERRRDDDGYAGDREHRAEGGGEGRHDGGGKGGHNLQCFLKGTRILTAAGEREIETIAPGDVVSTAFGGLREVQSIGTFSRFRSARTGAWPADTRPVRIARSALAPNVPHRDLYVTQGHSLLFDDTLVPAGSLVNGTTVSLCVPDDVNRLDFFHITLSTHDVIYAEGAPCETLLDETTTVVDDPMRPTTGEPRHCAPIICNGTRSTLKIRLRSLMSPWLGPQKFDTLRAALEVRAVSMSAS